MKYLSRNEVTLRQRLSEDRFLIKLDTFINYFVSPADSGLAQVAQPDRVSLPAVGEWKMFLVAALRQKGMK